MTQIYSIQKSHQNPLYCCWHADKLYVAESKDSKFYFVRFDECNRSNRGWSYLDLLSVSEGLIGTKKVFKLVVRSADNDKETPFLIMANKMVRGQFKPNQDND